METTIILLWFAAIFLLFIVLKLYWSKVLNELISLKKESSRIHDKLIEIEKKVITLNGVINSLRQLLSDFNNAYNETEESNSRWIIEKYNELENRLQCIAQLVNKCDEILNEQKEYFDMQQLAEEQAQWESENDTAVMKAKYLHILNRIQAGENLSAIAKSLSDDHCKVKTSELSAFVDDGTRRGWDQPDSESAAEWHPMDEHADQPFAIAVIDCGDHVETAFASNVHLVRTGQRWRYATESEAQDHRRECSIFDAEELGDQEHVVIEEKDTTPEGMTTEQVSAIADSMAEQFIPESK